jgi:hypothetical protein
MTTVAPPLKYSVSPVLVIMLTDGGPNCEITCALVVPTGIVGIVDGNGSTVAGTGKTLVGSGATVVGSTDGIGATGGKPMFSCGKKPTGGIAGPTLTITVLPDLRPNPLRR